MRRLGGSREGVAVESKLHVVRSGVSLSSKDERHRGWWEGGLCHPRFDKGQGGRVIGKRHDVEKRPEDTWMYRPRSMFVFANTPICSRDDMIACHRKI